MKHYKTPPVVRKRAKTAKRSRSKRKAPRLAAVKSGAKRAAAKPARERVRSHRQRMRDRGLRLVQLWLPDTRTAEFLARAHAASLAIANSPAEQHDQAFINSIQWWNSPEAEALSRFEPDPWWKERPD